MHEAAMATTSLQPLLNASKPSHHKTLYLFLSLATILITAAILTKVTLVNLPLQNSLSDHFAIDDKPSCLAMLTNKSSHHANLLQILLKKSKSQILNSIQEANHVSHQINDPLHQAALIDCQQLMDLSIDRIENSIVALKSATSTSYTNAHVWLSSVLTNHVTCLDGLNGPARLIMEPGLKNLISKSRSSLALMVRIVSQEKEDPITSLTGDFPSWVKSKERKLLQVSGKDIKANVIVAKDGSGNYKSVKEAVASAPNNGNNRYVIYVKKGIYKEHVEIGKSKTNVMLVGDGMDSTIITGSLNVVDGSTTFNSSTLAAVGDGFIAQDIWFQNTAGPQKHQAVALRVGADKSVINRCRIDAYQDTLYAHSNRQFYRDSLITGTVDFIFGNAAVVFQNCKLVARKPMLKQSNMVTAQGRIDPNQNTGISIQKCDIIASSDLEPVKKSVRSYLGRPWKEFSRTVVLQSNIGDHIDPAGWSIWEGEFALKTLYYGEYMNTGVGAGTSKRVKWPGFHVITSAAEAKKFTVAELIQGGAWLKSTGVAYTEGL